jgi:hypothetical protein
VSGLPGRGGREAPRGWPPALLLMTMSSKLVTLPERSSNSGLVTASDDKGQPDNERTIKAKRASFGTNLTSGHEKKENIQIYLKIGGFSVKPMTQKSNLYSFIRQDYFFLEFLEHLP